MTTDPSYYQSALYDFRQARQRAALQEVVGRLTGKSTRLLSYEEVATKLKLSARSDRGIQQIPVDAIVGSVGRYTDFSRTFLPRDAQDEQRWARVKTAFAGGEIPPIEVYKVGEVYFVLDGNHRVSIARQYGMEHIDANVIEVKTSVPLTPDIQPDDLIIKAEYAEFLEITRLAEQRPNVEIVLTSPGQYQKLLEQIEIECLSEDKEQCTCDEYYKAALCWYEEEYLPMVEAIQEKGLLRWFPGRTEADLVFWVLEHRTALEEETGWTARPDAAVENLAVEKSNRAESQSRKTGTWRKARMADRYIDRLFKDILVPLSGLEESWCALQQAIEVGAREKANVHGLHVVRSKKEKDSQKSAAIHSRFSESCEKAGLGWDFHVEMGEISNRICERARLTDLVVLNTAHPPEAGMAGFRSGLRTIIWKSPRPLLATCCSISTFDRALLAFDGSPKSKEALFVAAYIAEKWKTSLSVTTITNETHASPSALEYARAYLELHEIEAQYLEKSGPPEILHDVLDEQGINLLLMGGYGGTSLEERMAGSLVNVMLRLNHCPIFICH